MGQEEARVRLSDEQERLLDAVAHGRDVIVDAVAGSGKTTAIQALCEAQGVGRSVLYLTYSRLLKIDAQARVGNARVQNYHGVVYPSLLAAGLDSSVGESIGTFNARFGELADSFPRYDMIVVDEYQDIVTEYADLLDNIRSLNPGMQVVMVGDMEQKLRSDTTLDAQRFAAAFTDDAARLTFSQSFRLGPEMGELLSRAWNKPVVGVNGGQELLVASPSEALAMALEREPGDTLVLGKRTGAMTSLLNAVEREDPARFNKNTVYASIRERDWQMSYGPETAVFTTYDSSKGMERRQALVHDYDLEHWRLRNRFAGADPTVLRNVFLVAASRGKERIVFVTDKAQRLSVLTPGPRPLRAADDEIGAVPTRAFADLPVVGADYSSPLWASECFDFKYVENVEACHAMLSLERLDDGTGAEIAIERADGLIDLSPVVGHYAEAVYFDRYEAAVELESRPGATGMRAQLFDQLGDDDKALIGPRERAWYDALVLAAVDTNQERYVTQVTARIPDGARAQIVARLAEHLDRSDPVQQPLMLTGTGRDASWEATTAMSFAGVMDVSHGRTVYELKFVTELSHAMFLQLGLYLAMEAFASGSLETEEGVLWNIRTGERWSVRVEDVAAFMDAVVTCVTKQAFTGFEPDGGW